MANLITVPTFIFKQGDFGEDNYELPVVVQYYADGVITLASFEGGEALVKKENVKKLFKEIEKHFPAAENSIKNRK